MRKVKTPKRIYGLVFVLLIMMVGIQANAAKALNQAFATSARSVLLDKATISYTA